MEQKKVWAVYWSATGNTDKVVNTVAESLAGKLGLPLERRSFTRPGERREALSFADSDLVVLGMPPMRGSCPIRCCPSCRRRSWGTELWRWDW